jgi:hypothetical protein
MTSAARARVTSAILFAGAALCALASPTAARRDRTVAGDAVVTLFIQFPVRRAARDQWQGGNLAMPRPLCRIVTRHSLEKPLCLKVGYGRDRRSCHGAVMTPAAIPPTSPAVGRVVLTSFQPDAAQNAQSESGASHPGTYHSIGPSLPWPTVSHLYSPLWQPNTAITCEALGRLRGLRAFIALICGCITGARARSVKRLLRLGDTP